MDHGQNHCELLTTAGIMKQEELIDSIKKHQPQTIPETKLSAAVIVLILKNQHDFEVVLTKRAQLATYAGDYSFPGGIRETTDVDLLMTAQRELDEELNIKPNQYTTIGQLDDFLDRYEQLVRPYVAVMDRNEFDDQYIMSSDEITSIYYFPFNQLADLTDTPHLHKITRRQPSYASVIDDSFVWGLTANILVHLDNIIFNKTRPIGKIPQQPE